MIYFYLFMKEFVMNFICLNDFVVMLLCVVFGVFYFVYVV